MCSSRQMAMAVPKRTTVSIGRSSLEANMGLAKMDGTPGTYFILPIEALTKDISQILPLSNPPFNILRKWCYNQILACYLRYSYVLQYSFFLLSTTSFWKSRVSFHTLVCLQNGIFALEGTLEMMKYWNSLPYSPYLPTFIIPLLA